MAIHTQVINRAKLLGIVLPCESLLRDLVVPALDLFACNLALETVAIGLKMEFGARRKACADAVLMCIESFATKPFCSQMHFLLEFSVQLLDEIRNIASERGLSSQVEDAIGDWLIDISLCQSSIRKVNIHIFPPL